LFSIETRREDDSACTYYYHNTPKFKKKKLFIPTNLYETDVTAIILYYYYMWSCHIIIVVSAQYPYAYIILMRILYRLIPYPTDVIATAVVIRAHYLKFKSKNLTLLPILYWYCHNISCYIRIHINLYVLLQRVYWHTVIYYIMQCIISNNVCAMRCHHKTSENGWRQILDARQNEKSPYDIIIISRNYI